MKYLKFYNIQTCNLFIYNNATVSWFCFYFTNAQNIDNAEGTKSKPVIKQTNMSANTNINKRNSDNRSSIKQTSTEINCNDILRDQTTYRSTSYNNSSRVKQNFHFFSDPGPVYYHISLVLTYFLLVRKEKYLVPYSMM